MRKTLSASILLLALSASAYAGNIPNDSPTTTQQLAGNIPNDNPTTTQSAGNIPTDSPTTEVAVNLLQTVLAIL